MRGGAPSYRTTFKISTITFCPPYLIQKLELLTLIGSTGLVASCWIKVKMSCSNKKNAIGKHVTLLNFKFQYFKNFTISQIFFVDKKLTSKNVRAKSKIDDV